MVSLFKFHVLSVSENVLSKTKRLLQHLLFSALILVSGGKVNTVLYSHHCLPLTSYNLYRGFATGIFPLPNMRNRKKVKWYDPNQRGIIPIKDFKVQEGLLRILKKDLKNPNARQFEVRINSNFEETVLGCSKPRNAKGLTWLSAEYMKALTELHQLGIAHSVETYQNGVLVGGVIGVSIGSYFNTLSLFHTVNNASKVAFYHLLVKLKQDGFALHDFGNPNPWVSQFGLDVFSRDNFKMELMKAVSKPNIFTNNLPNLDFLLNPVKSKNESAIV